ncbi:hypothetical protein F2Q69_00013536 [Brassica cretica]|uniref:Uncharacterized protein n=1 Tax=Brassica cretica TaxID=69181 RepID=A0A8S9QW47_BRACR|nr:hypothetical protein F2Q69_00013536 [Brassica cretica]
MTRRSLSFNWFNEVQARRREQESLLDHIHSDSADRCQNQHNGSNPKLWISKQECQVRTRLGPSCQQAGDMTTFLSSQEREGSKNAQSLKTPRKFHRSEKNARQKNSSKSYYHNLSGGQGHYPTKSGITQK